MISTLPQKLKEKYPKLQIYTYPRGFNPIVFYQNPYVEKIDYLPDEVFGDDANWGNGHNIQIKEQFFDLPVSEDPKPQIFLGEREKSWAEKTAAPVQRPIGIIHPWGSTYQDLVGVDYWEKLVQSRPDVSFWQVGVEGQAKIPGCQAHFLLPKTVYNARKLFALTSMASFFLGVDSGPMHVARAFDIPSLIYTIRDADDIFLQRKKTPYFAKGNLFQGFIYEPNEHLNFEKMDSEALFSETLAFIDRFRAPQ